MAYDQATMASHHDRDKATNSEFELQGATLRSQAEALAACGRLGPGIAHYHYDTPGDHTLIGYTLPIDATGESHVTIMLVGDEPHLILERVQDSHTWYYYRERHRLGTAHYYSKEVTALTVGDLFEWANLRDLRSSRNPDQHAAVVSAYEQARVHATKVLDWGQEKLAFVAGLMTAAAVYTDNGS